MRRRELDAMRASDRANTLRLSGFTYPASPDPAVHATTPSRSMHQFVKAHLAHCALDPEEKDPIR